MSKPLEPLIILQSLSEATAEIVNKTSSTVVTVNNGTGSRSGTVWSPEGYIVTSSNVFGKPTKIQKSLGEKLTEQTITPKAKAE